MWFWYALGAAFMSTVSVMYNKKLLRKVRASTLSWYLFVFQVPIILIYTVFSGVPKVNATFFYAILVAGLAFSAGKTIQLHLFKHNDLSETYSLQSISPLTLYLLSLVFLSEKISSFAVAGIIIMTVSIYLLKFERGNRNIFHPLTSIFNNRASLMYVGVILLSNITAISEKTALNNMSTLDNPLYVSLWEFIVLSVVTFVFMVGRNKDWKKEIKDNFWSLSFAGMVYFLLAAMVIWGFTDGPIALVASVKKLEVLFVIILSYFIFKEKPSKYLYIGVLLSLVAAVLVKL